MEIFERRKISLLALFVCCCLYTINSQATVYGNRDFYLVDSLDFATINSTDSVLLDSCLQVYHSAKQDTNRVHILNLFIEECRNNDIWPKYNQWILDLIQEKLDSLNLVPLPSQSSLSEVKSLKLLLAGSLNNFGFSSSDKGENKLALEYYRSCLKIQKEIGYEKGIIDSYNNMGTSLSKLGNIPLALEYFNKSLKMAKETRLSNGQMGDKNSMAYAYNNIGYVQSSQGDIPRALESYHKSLKIREEIKDKNGLAYTLNNIGFIHTYQDDIPLALDYFHRSLKIREEIRDLNGMSQCYNNIGSLHQDKGDFPLALEYLQKSLALRQKIGNKQGIANSYNNIGGIHQDQKDTSLALEYYFKCYYLSSEIGHKQGMARGLANISKLKFRLGFIEEAAEKAELSLKYAQEIGSPDLVRFAAGTLSLIARKKGDYKEALEMFELEIKMRDSINNEETQKATILQQTKYEFEKAELIKEQTEKEMKRLRSEDLERRNNLQYSIIFICILLVFSSVLGLGFVKVSPRVAEGLIFFAILILFEFLLVLTDPYVDNWTGGAPGWKLLVNALVASLIFPLHSFFERLLRRRLMKKEY